MRPLVIAGHEIRPPFLSAPMAGITHSAYRRLVADFGGCGALSTEMLSARAVIAENLKASPFTKKRPCEGRVFYQLLLTGEENIPRVIERLETLEPFGIDINLGCPAPEIRRGGEGGGIEVFNNREKLRIVLGAVRQCWKGTVTVKCRLGRRGDTWQETFLDRLKIIEESGIDAVTVHPRFSDEKLKRRARWELFPWIASQTKLPVIANGDIVAPVPAALDLLAPGKCSGLMIGRMAVVKPWIFREFAGESVNADYLDVWTRFYDYVCDDFRPEKAIGRIKEFTAYFSRNFIYGHELFRKVQSAPDLATLKKRAVAFLSASPAVEKEPSVMGI
ncbi:MAG: tRNA-dihydrouridine synthase family protein [Chitinispirillaceae bacterium]|nr:tRNA-dihydrouridine synthase family protein [Chitinispirillaceae bacterium]